MDGLRTLRVGIAPPSYVRKRTIEIARGAKPHANEPKIWVSSFESLAKILSERNMLLLSMIRNSHAGVNDSAPPSDGGAVNGSGVSAPDTSAVGDR
jgi:predicted transcriptional regulator